MLVSMGGHGTRHTMLSKATPCSAPGRDWAGTKGKAAVGCYPRGVVFFTVVLTEQRTIKSTTPLHTIPDS